MALLFRTDFPYATMIGVISFTTEINLPGPLCRSPPRAPQCVGHSYAHLQTRSKTSTRWQWIKIWLHKDSTQCRSWWEPWMVQNLLLLPLSGQIQCFGTRVRKHSRCGLDQGNTRHMLNWIWDFWSTVLWKWLVSWAVVSKRSLATLLISFLTDTKALFYNHLLLKKSELIHWKSFTGRQQKQQRGRFGFCAPNTGKLNMRQSYHISDSEDSGDPCPGAVLLLCC